MEQMEQQPRNIYKRVIASNTIPDLANIISDYLPNELFANDETCTQLTENGKKCLDEEVLRKRIPVVDEETKEIVYFSCTNYCKDHLRAAVDNLTNIPEFVNRVKIKLESFELNSGTYNTTLYGINKNDKLLIISILDSSGICVIKICLHYYQEIINPPFLFHNIGEQPHRWLSSNWKNDSDSKNLILNIEYRILDDFDIENYISNNIIPNKTDEEFITLIDADLIDIDADLINIKNGQVLDINYLLSKIERLYLKIYNFIYQNLNFKYTLVFIFIWNKF
jgi:hypothetical protein